jgi:hypothetical protein
MEPDALRELEEIGARFPELNATVLPGPRGGSGGARRHHLPAAAIGRFSFDTTKPKRRNRPVWVLRNGVAEPFVQSPENVGFVEGLYGYGTSIDNDNFFKASEDFVHQPVDNICRQIGDNTIGTYKISDWAKVAWYISTLFMRGPEFEEAAKQQVDMAFGAGKVPTMMLYEWSTKKLSSAVMRANWQFVANVENDFILPDRGVTGMCWFDLKTFGYVVPLRPHFGVKLGPAPSPKLVKWDGTDWVIDIPTKLVGKGFGQAMNGLSYIASRKECYGSSAELLTKARDRAGDVPEFVREMSQNYQSGVYLGLNRERDEAEQEILMNLAFNGPRDPAAGDVTEFLL